LIQGLGALTPTDGARGRLPGSPEMRGAAGLSPEPKSADFRYIRNIARQPLQWSEPLTPQMMHELGRGTRGHPWRSNVVQTSPKMRWQRVISANRLGW